MSGFNPKWIVGKTIASIEMHPLKARNFGGSVAHEPIIIFTDGSYIQFVTEETDHGIYGTDIIYTPQPTIPV